MTATSLGIPGAICDGCGEPFKADLFDSRWRWNGAEWEHKCPDAPPQVGHVGRLALRVPQRPAYATYAHGRESVRQAIAYEAMTPQSMESRFADWHQRNPAVYARLVEMARALRVQGWRHYGIATLYEALRYEHDLRARNSTDFKLNNNYRAAYARLIMAQESDLAGFFETRESKFDAAESVAELSHG